MAENANTATNHPGMGAVIDTKGVTFRRIHSTRLRKLSKVPLFYNLQGGPSG